MAINHPRLLEAVALLRPILEYGLVRGQVGTIVDVTADGALLVEFADEDGRTKVLLPLRADDVLGLTYASEPV